MVTAAKALVKTEFYDVPNDVDRIVAEFKTRLVDTQKFWDPFAAGKFSQYFFLARDKSKQAYNAESVHQLLEEAQLFIDAAHSCYNKMTPAPVAAKA
jgi:sulfite reductase (ferredoxin)